MGTPKRLRVRREPALKGKPGWIVQVKGRKDYGSFETRIGAENLALHHACTGKVAHVYKVTVNFVEAYGPATK